MATIHLATTIRAPRERVFDLARSIDVHLKSTERTRERAIAGVTRGLISMGDEVTWEARHFGIRQRLTVRITGFDRPGHFQDVMLRGAFKRMVHDHIFQETPSGTQMIDRFEFTSPFGLLGSIIDRLFLSGYLRGFLVQRNQALKELAETDGWQHYLGASKETNIHHKK